MSERKIETAKGMCAVFLTKFLMKRNNWAQDTSYAYFMGMELYQLLMDTDTGMYLEPDEYLFECCEIEASCGVDVLYDFIKVA